MNDVRRRPAIERFQAKVGYPPSGCWEWVATITDKGYGRFFLNNTYVAAHRWSYEYYVGPIPKGLEIAHLCGVRHCVNPAHLEAVTRREVLLRGDTLPARQVRRTHCPKGHAYDEVNTYVRPSGRRTCKKCDVERSDRYSRTHPPVIVPRRLRAAVFERDGRVCRTCGATDRLTLDHIIPSSRGGPNTLENLQVLCLPCNARKGNKVA